MGMETNDKPAHAICRDKHSTAVHIYCRKKKQKTRKEFLEIGQPNNIVQWKVSLLQRHDAKWNLLKFGKAMQIVAAINESVINIVHLCQQTNYTPVHNEEKWVAMGNADNHR